MSDFIKAFRSAVESVLSDYPEVQVELISDNEKPKEVAIIKRIDNDGFNVTLECFSYGLYPSADGWIGAPWDVTVWGNSELEKSVREFLYSVLSTYGKLEIFYSNGKAYKWILHFKHEGERSFEIEKTTFYNWFGNKSSRVFQNRTLSEDKCI